ncbi:OmpA family protein [Allohahella sp. A8]|uniref:OmpA family protein n=1 Tax=Allohahella sp. A8 TaxID=3141461 RepID=UPI003A80F134
MKATIRLLMCCALSSGCASQGSFPVYSANDVAGNSKARGLAAHYHLTTDVKPSAFNARDSRQRYQSFQQGCVLDFHPLVKAAPGQRPWELRESNSASGHLGSYKRFVSGASFAQGRHDIPDSLAEDLKWFAREMARSPLMPFVLIIGHTNVDGNAAYNQMLSEKRAAAARRFLISQGVLEQRVQQFGVGETSPLQMREAARSWSLNRRIELITFLPSDANRKQPRCAEIAGLALSDLAGGSQQ